MHNQAHTWTGGVIADASDGLTVFGTMNLPTSPNDPVFFLNHSNIDRLWAKWQGLHGGAFEPASEANVVLDPFTAAGAFTPRSVESTRSLGYTYSNYQDSDDVLVAPADLPRSSGGRTRAYVCDLPDRPWPARTT